MRTIASFAMLGVLATATVLPAYADTKYNPAPRLPGHVGKEYTQARLAEMVNSGDPPAENISVYDINGWIHRLPGDDALSGEKNAIRDELARAHARRQPAHARSEGLAE